MATQTFTLRASTAAAGAVLLVGLGAAPALADYPPSTTGGGQTPVDNSVTTTSGGPAYTGSATTIGLLTGLAVAGAGAGLLIASRRRSN